MAQTNILTPQNLQISLHRWSSFGSSPNSSNTEKNQQYSALFCFGFENFRKSYLWSMKMTAQISQEKLLGEICTLCSGEQSVMFVRVLPAGAHLSPQLPSQDFAFCAHKLQLWERILLCLSRKAVHWATPQSSQKTSVQPQTLTMKLFDVDTVLREVCREAGTALRGWEVPVTEETSAVLCPGISKELLASGHICRVSVAQ